MHRPRRCIRAASPQILRAPRDTHPASSPNCRPRLRRRLPLDYPRYSVDASTLLFTWGAYFLSPEFPGFRIGGRKIDIIEAWSVARFCKPRPRLRWLLLLTRTRIYRNIAWL